MKRLLLCLFFVLCAVPTYAALPEGFTGDEALRREAARFAEPLVRTSPTSANEDAELKAAILHSNAATEGSEFAILRNFVDLHPGSGWRLSLLTNLGLSYVHDGYFTNAVDAFERAWAIGKTVHDGPARALADRAGGELLRIHARLGHAQRVADLLGEVHERAMTGPATEMLDDAKEGLYLMRHDPGRAYLCGPMALRALLSASGATEQEVAFLDKTRAGSHGTTLDQVAGLASSTRFAFRAIHRDAGAAIPVPSLVHWKVNHYAAIVRVSGQRYEVIDPTFGPTPLWLTAEAIDSEASGYFLVPVHKQAQGWREVASLEAGHVVGAGFIQSFLDSIITYLDKSAQDCGCKGRNMPAGPGMSIYSFKEANVSLNLSDTPVGYAPPIGKAVWVTFTYNQREAGQPANFSFFNVSSKWTMNWLTYIEDDPTMAGATVSRYAAGGGTVYYNGYNTATQAFSPDFYDASVLTYVAGSHPSYTRAMPDGSLETYNLSNGAMSYPRLIFLTKITDPAGNAVTLNYDNQYRLISIKDAAGRLTTFTYGSAFSPLLITAVTDPFGRSAKMTYDSFGRLSMITDVIGLQSSFSYDSSSEVDALTTAYGTTHFSYGDESNYVRFLQATDPLGNTERLEYNQNAGVPPSDPGVPAGLINPINNYLDDRDTFYWDKHAYAAAAGNYNQARIRHWAHYAPGGNLTSTSSNTLESVKPALENRTWFSYPGQPEGYASGTFNKPTQAARILDNGSTQLTQFAYNAAGNPTSVVDPAGHTTLWSYAGNGIDVMSVQQMIGAAPATIAAYSYNGQHRPLTYTDAAGQTYHYTFNPAGQIASATDPLGHTTKFNYGSAGDLTSIVNADGKTAASFTYDAFDRIATRKDSQGWTVSYAYDALDRVTQETFPDQTSRVFTYQNLDLMLVKDRQGRTTTATYDAVRNLTSVTDPMGDVTRFGYYENKVPKTLTDPNGNVTTWNVDVESRVTGKAYANHQGVTTTYEATSSRVHAITDALGQSKMFSYGVDDTLASIVYAGALNATPSVGFTYDPSFRRITSMTDGSGTTTYGYEPPGALGALKLASENPPFANAAIAYYYDALGRVTGRSVGGDVETVAYDAIGRVVTHADDLGTFALTYLGETSQLTSRISGNVGTRWLYAGNKNDRRLTGIINSPVASRYTYATTPENDITGINEDSGYQIWKYTYDKADRLTVAASSLSNNYGFGYDAASNLGPIQTPSGSTTVTSNALNQVAAYGTTPFKYDANGNLLADYARTYAWDAENRLIAIGYPGTTGTATQLTYDGLGRRTSITDTASGTTTQTHFGWCGQSLCQARSSTDAFLKRYLAEGEVGSAPGSGLYYGIDQLGSVRDAIAVQNGLRKAHFDYSPYGAQTTSVGMPAGRTDFRYAGLFYHQLSGLEFATYRQYDPAAGRWISRDPIDEKGGMNLYALGRSNPASDTDTTGLSPTEQSSSPLSQSDPNASVEWPNSANETYYDPTVNSGEAASLCDLDKANTEFRESMLNTVLGGADVAASLIGKETPYFKFINAPSAVINLLGSNPDLMSVGDLWVGIVSLGDPFMGVPLSVAWFAVPFISKLYPPTPPGLGPGSVPWGFNGSDM